MLWQLQKSICLCGVSHAKIGKMLQISPEQLLNSVQIQLQFSWTEVNIIDNLWSLLIGL